MAKLSREEKKLVILIPARGGSKGIPGKNLRPFLGKPLIQRSIETALSVPNSRIIVNTESSDIATWTKSHFPSVEVYLRPYTLALDTTTLDEVALEMAQSLRFGEGIIITLQPTSPLLEPKTLKEALAFFENSAFDSMVSVSEERKLSWRMSITKGYSQNFVERVNRQQLPPNFVENGAFIICRMNKLIEHGSRITPSTTCFTISEREAVDIDTPSDWHLAEYLGRGTKIFFVLEANKQMGSGHLHRALTLAEYFPDFLIEFVLINTEEQFNAILSDRNYSTHAFESFADSIELLSDSEARAVVIDWLDTSSEMINLLREKTDAKLVSFEDLGSGSNETDLTINELYPHNAQSDRILSGPDYCVMRREFFDIQPKAAGREFDLLIAFGGTDPNDQTLRVLRILQAFSSSLNIAVLLGLGAKDQLPSLEDIAQSTHHEVDIFAGLTTVAGLMASSKACVTSSGRTVYELAVCHTKTICICQNTRELTHMFARANNGIQNLGLFSEVDDETIAYALENALSEPNLIHRLKLNPHRSLQNVVSAIRTTIGAI